MSQVATQVMPDETDEHLMFSVRQTREMLERFQKRYCALWTGEERGLRSAGADRTERATGSGWRHIAADWVANEMKEAASVGGLFGAGLCLFLTEGCCCCLLCPQRNCFQ
jgi:hypothetical protein